jgi:hypothetical protein
MTALRRCFESLTALRKDRLYALSCVEAKPEWKDEFFDLAHDASADRSAIYAAWVWEFYCLKNLSNYKEQLNISLERLVPLQHSGMRRVHSKILWSFIKEKTNYDALNNSQKKNHYACFGLVDDRKQNRPHKFLHTNFRMFAKRISLCSETFGRPYSQFPKYLPKRSFPQYSEGNATTVIQRFYSSNFNPSP